MESGQKKKVVILNVDMLKLEVHVSLCQDLVNRKAKKVSLLMTSISVILKASYTPIIPHILLRGSDTNAWKWVDLPASFLPSLYLSSWCSYL